MRRAALVAFLTCALAGVAALTLLGATERRTLAFTLGVPPFGTAAALAPGQSACQAPIPASTAFDAVELRLRGDRAVASQLDVTARRAPGGAPLGRGTLVVGAPGTARTTVPVGHVPSGGEIAVCVRNAGTRRVALLGGPDVTARTSTATLDGRPTRMDLDLVFRRARPRSTLALLPQMLDRAALFRAGWIGAWLFWVLLAAVVLAVPALLARALWSASSR